MKTYLNTSLATQKRERHELVKHNWVMAAGIVLCLVAIVLAITSSNTSATTPSAPTAGLVITPLR